MLEADKHWEQHNGTNKKPARKCQKSIDGLSFHRYNFQLESLGQELVK